MIMPYGRKATQVEPSSSAPGEIDFNALWDKAFKPMLKGLGYQPVRADQETGALIVNEMIERLYFSDLVLADMTIPNGNVYYEVGIRHAAKKSGCVLLAADWSKQLFDVIQMRTLRYPLPEGSITDACAELVTAKIEGEIEAMKRGVSPMYQSIGGYPDKVKEAAASTMKDVMAAFADFQGELEAVRALPGAGRMARARELVDKYWKPPVTPPTALALTRMLKNSVHEKADWAWISDFLVKLTPDVAEQDEVKELSAFALANSGKPLDAIAKLNALIADSGPTPERLGMLGGRYKRLYTSGTTIPTDQSLYLNQSISAYERGMELDLNQYYCSCNLPRLYRQRQRKDDEDRAQSVSKVVLAACERARKLGVGDEWLKATLLGAAFDAGDCDKADSLADQVADDGPALWKIDSICGDLKLSIAQMKDEQIKERLAAILKRLAPEAAT
jgi:MAP3K TRAFs-binding domain